MFSFLSLNLNAQCGFRYSDYMKYKQDSSKLNIYKKDSTKPCHRDTPHIEGQSTKMIKPIKSKNR